MLSFKFEEKLGAGLMGTVYKANLNDKKVIAKIEKYDGDLTTKSTYIRQIYFQAALDKHPDLNHHFLKLIFYGVIDDCNHKQVIPEWIGGKFRKRLEEFALKHKKCSLLVYTPILPHTLRDVRGKITKKQKLNGLYQIVEACGNLMEMGFQHNDIHPRNIMYKGNEWYLVDYGTINHKKFIQDKKDRQRNDILSTVWTFMEDKFWDFLEKTKFKLPPFKVHIEHIQKDPRYDDIKKYLPPTRNKSVIWDAIDTIAYIKYNDLFLDSCNLDHTKYPELLTKPDNAELLLYIVQHCMDDNYKLILNAIKKCM